VLTQAHIDEMRRLAGYSLSWSIPGPRGLGNRPSSAYRAGLRRYLVSAQDGRCAACGRELGSDAQLCHIVARGPHRRGWHPGNIYAGHQQCNYDDRSYGDALPLTRFALPAIIPMAWPKKLKAYT
jgi:hypothetical protein